MTSLEVDDPIQPWYLIMGRQSGQETQQRYADWIKSIFPRARNYLDLLPYDENFNRDEMTTDVDRLHSYEKQFSVSKLSGPVSIASVYDQVIHTNTDDKTRSTYSSYQFHRGFVSLFEYPKFKHNDLSQMERISHAWKSSFRRYGKPVLTQPLILIVNKYSGPDQISAKYDIPIPLLSAVRTQLVVIDEPSTYIDLDTRLKWIRETAPRLLHEGAIKFANDITALEEHINEIQSMMKKETNQIKLFQNAIHFNVMEPELLKLATEQLRSNIKELYADRSDIAIAREVAYGIARNQFQTNRSTPVTSKQLHSNTGVADVSQHIAQFVNRDTNPFRSKYKL